MLQIEHAPSLRVGHNIYVKNIGNVTLGRRCAIGSFSKFWNYASISIGDDFLSAGSLVINTATHDVVTLDAQAAPVRIGNNVWCGQNVIILAGVTIGDRVVIGAGSVVSKDIPSNCVAVGAPCRKIKELIRPP